MDASMNSDETIEISRSSHILQSTLSDAIKVSRFQDLSSSPKAAADEVNYHTLLTLILDIYERDRVHDNRLVLSKIVTANFWQFPIIGEGKNFTVRDGFSGLPGGSIYSSRKTVQYIRDDGEFELPRLVSKHVRTKKEDTSLEKRQQIIDQICLELRAMTHRPLKMHENIVDFHGLMWEQTEENKILPVLLIEKADFGTLADLQEEVVLDIEAKLELCIDVAKGLEAIHACGIAHCDVKNENVLIFRHASRKYVAKLADFGSSLLGLTSSHTDLRRLRPRGYTPLWAAPEFKPGVKPESLTAADIYSFGLLLWRTMSGGTNPLRRNFGSDLDLTALDQLKASPELLRLANIEVSERLKAPHSEIVKSALEATIQVNPTSRSLPKALAGLESCSRSKDRRILSPFRFINSPIARDLHSSHGITMFDALELHFIAQLDVHIQSFFGAMIDRRLDQSITTTTGSKINLISKEDMSSSRLTLAMFFLENIGTAPLSGFYDAVPGQNAVFGLLGSSCEGSPDFGPKERCIVKKPSITSALALLRNSLTGDDTSKFGAQLLAQCIALAYQRFSDVDTEWFRGLPMMGFLPLNDWIARTGGESDLLSSRRELLQNVAIRAILAEMAQGSLPDSKRAQGLEAARNMLEHDIYKLWMSLVTSDPDPEGMIDWRKTNQKTTQKLLELSPSNIFIAARLGSTEHVSKLLHKADRDPIVNSRDRNDNTPLILSCSVANIASAVCLMQHGADAGLPGQAMAGCFHYLFTFVGEEQKQVAEMLRDNGAKVNQLSKGVRLNSVDQLLMGPIDGSPLHSAVLANDLSAVQILMCYGGDPLIQNSEFITPLELAASLNTCAILEHILQQSQIDCSTWTDHYGNNLVFSALNIRWNRNRILLHHVNYFQEIKATLALLKERGASFEQLCDGNDISALHLAISSCSSNVVSLLLSVGCHNLIDKQAFCDGARTPLMRSVSRGDESLALILLQHGANVSVRTPLGETAMHFCAMGAHDTDFYVKTLLKNGAEIDPEDDDGRTPLLVAIGRKRFKVAEALLAAGANKEHSFGGMTILGRLLRTYDHPLPSLTWLIAPLHSYGACSLLVDSKSRGTILHVLAMQGKRLYCTKAEMSSIANSLADVAYHHGIIGNRDEMGFTALHFAVADRNLEVCTALLSTRYPLCKDEVLLALATSSKGGNLDEKDPFYIEIMAALERISVTSTKERSLRDLSRVEALQLFLQLVKEAQISCEKFNGPDDYFVLREREDIKPVQHLLTTSRPALSEMLALRSGPLHRSFYVNHPAGYLFQRRKDAKPWERFASMLMLPYGNHGTLEDLLEGRSEQKLWENLPISLRLGFCIDLTSAVMDIHSCNVVHGMICPANAYVFDAEGRPTIVFRGILNAPHNRPMVARLTNFDDAKIRDSYTTDHVFKRREDDYDSPEGTSGKYQPMSFDRLVLIDNFALGILILKTCGLSVVRVRSICSLLPSNSSWPLQLQSFRSLMPRFWVPVAYELTVTAALWLTEPDWRKRPVGLGTINSMLNLALAIQMKRPQK